jgi:hypothetical protein
VAAATPQPHGSLCAPAATAAHTHTTLWLPTTWPPVQPSWPTHGSSRRLVAAASAAADIVSRQAAGLIIFATDGLVPLLHPLCRRLP